MSAPLNFGSSGNPFDDTKLSGYDAAPGADALDLTGFDDPAGPHFIPAGVYILRVERGEFTRMKAGKNGYRLCLKVVEPTEHAGHTLWRWHLMGNGDRAQNSKAGAALAPLSITQQNCRAAYPPVGRDVFVKALVTLKNDPQRGPSNDVERFEPCPPPASAVAPPNPFAVPLTPPDAEREGGKQ